MHSAVPDPAAQAVLQRRTIATLRLAQVPGQAAVAGIVTVIAVLVGDLLHSDRFAGSGGAAFTLGSALMAPYLAALMRRRGRRPGLALAFTIGAFGAVIAAIGGQTRTPLVLLLGMTLFGGVQAGTLQGRYAAADLAAPGQGPRAIAAVVWLGTLGAVFGPVLTAFWKHVAPSVGLDPLIGPIAVAAVLSFVAAAVIWFRLRPDPLIAAGGVDPHAARTPVVKTVGRSLRTIRASPLAVLGLASMVVAQVTMTGVMTMTPPHMRDHQHGSMSPYVIALHIAGMYGLAPLVGRYVERVSPQRAVITGALVTTTGTAAAVLAGYQPVLIFVGLFLLGLGWNIGIVAGSSLVTTSVPLQSKVEVQGAADFMMSFCGGLAAFGSGFVKQAFGFHLLANIASLLGLGLVAYTVFGPSRFTNRADAY